MVERIKRDFPDTEDVIVHIEPCTQRDLKQKEGRRVSK
ncbi:MAG: hypothetical protein DRO05_04710 [Thermoproteota archaeon]|nr:MAG: hypothetical protein DRO05_04710 [Candidatus Korarchaeota archaeon]